MEKAQPNRKKSFSAKVGEKEDRRLQAQRQKKSVWSGLGLFGMVGWSVSVPALLGTALGIWLDKKYQESFSWTLSLFITGLIIGCLIAWSWIQKENKEIHKNKEDENE